MALQTQRSASINVTRPLMPGILDRPLIKPKTEVSLSSFALLFSGF